MFGCVFVCGFEWVGGGCLGGKVGFLGFFWFWGFWVIFGGLVFLVKFWVSALEWFIGGFITALYVSFGFFLYFCGGN